MFNKLDSLNNTNDGSRVERALLAQTLKSENQGTEIFAWAKRVLPNEIPPNSVFIKKLGQVCNVPVSYKNIKKLKKMSRKYYYEKWKNTCVDLSLQRTQENYSSIIKIPKLMDFFISLISQNSGVPAEHFGITFKPSRLILYETEGYYQLDQTYKQKFDTFGTIILQLPVEGGHTGGRLIVEYQNRVAMFENEHRSEKDYYVSMLYGNSKCASNVLKSGFKIILVINLMWTNPKGLKIRKNVPIFFSVVQKLNKVLAPLMSERTGKNISNNRFPSQVMPSNLSIAEYLKMNEITYNLHLDGHYSEMALKKDILFFVLEEKYSNGCSERRGQDKVLLDNLQCVPFVDVHSAVATVVKTTTRRIHSSPVRVGHKRAEENGCSCENEKTSVSFSRWKDIIGNFRKLSLDLDWEKQRVDSFRKITSNEPYREKRCWRKDEQGRPIEIVTQSIDYCVLVIWPKEETLANYCRYGLHSLLDHMEHVLLNQFNHMKPFQQVTEDLSKIISFCYTEPIIMWRNSTNNKGELALKLLRICISLKAREDGLRLLHILGSRVQVMSSDGQIMFEIFEGIQSNQVARAIAKFVSQVAGWRDCADKIQRIVTPDQFAIRPLPIVELAENLLEVNCFKGAQAVRDFLPFANVNQPLTVCLNEMAVDAYVDLFILLESYPETSNQDKDKSLTYFFSKLEFSMQSYLLWNLNALKENRLKGIQSCLKILEEMNGIFYSTLARGRSAENIRSEGNGKVNEKDAEDVGEVIILEGAEESSSEESSSEESSSEESCAKESCAKESCAKESCAKESCAKESCAKESCAKESAESYVDSDTSVNLIMSYPISSNSTSSKDGVLTSNAQHPSINWRMPQANVPGHPEVESFLRSNRTEMTSSNFLCAADARRFLARKILTLETTPEGICCRGVTQGRGKTARCLLYKHFINTESSEPSSDEEVIILPQVDRPKVEEIVIDFD